MIRALAAFVAIIAGTVLVVTAVTNGSSGGAAPGRAERAATQPIVPPTAASEAETVPQATPRWIAIDPAILDRTDLNPDGVRAVNGVVVPSDNRPAFRTDSNLPGTDSPGTSFIVGHNYRDPSGVAIPFAALEKVTPGDTIRLGTDNGILRYRVSAVFTVPKNQLAQRADLLENVAGRLILETCDTTVDGRDTTDNLVVITAPDGAEPAPKG